MGGTLGVVGVRLGLNPLEILDFLLGYVGVDIADDDVPEPELEDSPVVPVFPSTIVVESPESVTSQRG